MALECSFSSHANAISLEMTLSNPQKRYLKGLAHTLKPVVSIGNNGLTANVLAEVELALDHHELIKIKIPTDDKDQKNAMVTDIIAHSGAAKLQVIGHILTVYRPSEAKKITLPAR